jgi:hypothetical protein
VCASTFPRTFPLTFPRKNFLRVFAWDALVGCPRVAWDRKREVGIGPLGLGGQRGMRPVVSNRMPGGWDQTGAELMATPVGTLYKEETPNKRSMVLATPTLPDAQSPTWTGTGSNPDHD